MGNGDRKSRKGKIRLGSFGVRRPRKKHKNVVAKAVKVKTPEIIAEVKHSIKPEAVIKTKVQPKEETIVIAAEVKHETKAKAPAKTETKEKAEPKAKTKEKAEPKVKTESKVAPKTKKTKKEE